MNSRKITIETLDDDALEAAGLRFDRLEALIDLLAENLLDHSNPFVRRLADFAQEEIHEAIAEYRVLTGLPQDTEASHE